MKNEGREKSVWSISMLLAEGEGLYMKLLNTFVKQNNILKTNKTGCHKGGRKPAGEGRERSLGDPTLEPHKCSTELEGKTDLKKKAILKVRTEININVY